MLQTHDEQLRKNLILSMVPVEDANTNYEEKLLRIFGETNYNPVIYDVNTKGNWFKLVKLNLPILIIFLSENK